MTPFAWRYIKLLLVHACSLISVIAFSQCPPNIGFEAGSFDHWDCSIGSINSSNGAISLSNSGPVFGRHTLLQNTTPQALDQYGDFPINCPNGSGYSIQLGNSGTGRQAEQVSYTFTIPDNQNNYSIIYNYAVVFQNPSHAEWEQPKFTANVFDVTNNTYIGCSSFSYAASANLPGFKQSVQRDSIFYKPWTPVTIKLSGYAGRTIRLEFTTNDCTRGGHFGYAYVDVNENCSSPISGNVHCLTDSSQTLTAPFGFAGYRWFNADFSKVLSTDLTLTLTPPAAAGTVFAVEVTPFPGQGCIDTVYATIVSSGEIIDLRVPTGTLLTCISNPIDLTSSLITAGSSGGLFLSYYTDPTQVNYLATPKLVTTSGIYYIKAVNSAGCTVMKPVTLEIVGYPVLSIVDPPMITRPYTIDLLSAVKGSTNGLTFTYWTDSLATIPLPNPHAIEKTGRYFIKVTNEGDCSLVYGVNASINEAIISPPNAFSPNGDGVHDVWEIALLDLYPECIVEIYNRLGQLLFRSVGYLKPWDGKFNGIDQPVATYYYVIRLRGDLKAIGGSVTIVR
jgi:gliding motility-associated-like protein